MKLRRIAVLISLFCMVSVISAQSYYIRTEHNTNLRAVGSLTARIVVTVRSGTTLQVVGSLDRWLRINRNGREVWMAEWVGHSRVNGSGVPADVDNCCFVDRQCSSDQEWVDGYWAYQNNQCGAPVQSQEQTSAQTPVNLPGQVDNCCYVDRHCSSEQDWINGWFAFQNQQCLMPGQFGNKHGVIIVGGQGFIRQMEDSLDVLKNRSPHWYNYTISGLAKIVQRLESDIPGMDVNTRTFYLDYTDENPPGYTYWQHISNSAAMLSHEACHQHRHDQGLEAGGYPGEKACLALQIDVLKAINAPAFWINSYQHTLDNIDNPEYQWWLPGNY